MTTCRTAAALIIERAEGRLPARARVHLWLHLAACRDCRAYASQVRMVSRALGRLPMPVPGPAIVGVLMYELKRWRGRSHRPSDR